MGPQARMAAGHAPNPEAGDIAADAAQGVGPFVINLCSSTSPMALSHPDLPEMKRFSFFVSRRREDNRERFRLHMGYFSTLAEAEEWLTVIRDIYPGAWAGEAPGKKLRARAAAAALATQLPAPPTSVPSRVVSVSAAPAAPARAPAPVAAHSAPPTDLVVPTLHAAPAPVARVSTGDTARTLMQPVLASMPRPVAPSAPPVQARPAAPVAAAPARHAPPARAAAPAASRSAPTPAAPSRPAAKAVPKKPQLPGVPAALSGSNVREVMAQLDETGETRQMRVPQFRSAPPAVQAPSVARAQTSPVSAAPGVPGMRAAGSAAPGPRGPVPAAEQPRAKAPVQRPQAPAVAQTAPAAAMSDTQVLRVLEQRRDETTERGSDEADTGISLLKPDDTQTRLALKEAVTANAPVSFAVQLQWSVSPVQLDKVPPLAIFSAYTLYTVEGSREGRKWYGLRLGFFSDAISAKQVAYYVRSEFTSVAVVPVSPQEKVRAGAEETRAATGRFAKPNVPTPKIEEFKLFDDANGIASEASAPAPVAKPAAGAAKAPPTKKNKPLGKVRAREQKSSKTLEETLEILGAGDLEIDNGRGETLNDTGVRHLRVEVQKNTPFAKLLDRLSERVRRN